MFVAVGRADCWVFGVTLAAKMSRAPVRQNGDVHVAFFSERTRLVMDASVPDKLAELLSEVLSLRGAQAYARCFVDPNVASRWIRAPVLPVSIRGVGGAGAAGGVVVAHSVVGDAEHAAVVDLDGGSSHRVPIVAVVSARGVFHEQLSTDLLTARLLRTLTTLEKDIAAVFACPAAATVKNWMEHLGTPIWALRYMPMRNPQAPAFPALVGGSPGRNG